PPAVSAAYQQTLQDGSAHPSPTLSISTASSSIPQPQVNGTASVAASTPAGAQQYHNSFFHHTAPPPGLATPDIRDAAQDYIYRLPPGLQDLISSFESTRNRITNPSPLTNSPANLSRVLDAT